MKFIKLFTLFLLFWTGLFLASYAQDEPQGFTIVKEIKTTKVKNQGNTGTCWDFATVSFLESELLRLYNKEYDLAEMFIIRNAYPLKSDLYVRFHGHKSFGEGGQAHDALNIIRKYGIVPQDVYTGLKAPDTFYNHQKMESEIRTLIDRVVKTRDDFPGNIWKEQLNSILDQYLGKVPSDFSYNGKIYNPISFLKETKLNLDDYVEITSYSHQPFYKQFVLEVPDNWSYDLYYNVPVDELIRIMDNALSNGMSVAWDGDVSENGFQHDKGFARLPDESQTVSQENRQLTFDNWQTTDDHLMHITGWAKDANGKKYYLTKNSWGCTGKYKGYLYMSEPYVRMKTICILVHKSAVPSDIAARLGLK
jgi:bleomycin hydrolase